MPAGLVPFPDIEALLVGWLATRFGVRVLTSLPANLADILPVIQVTRTGGAETDPRLDRPNVDIDVYATDQPSAAALCEQVRAALRFELPYNGPTPIGVVTSVTTRSGPHWAPYDDTSLRRYIASYSLTSHA